MVFDDSLVEKGSDAPFSYSIKLKLVIPLEHPLFLKIVLNGNYLIFCIMAKISAEQKLDNYRNMCSMVSDYEKQYSRWPTNKEIEEKLGMNNRTVLRYKRDILLQSTKRLFDSFNYDTIFHAKKVISRINKNIKDCEKIYDAPNDNTEKMDTGQRILEYHLEAIKIMRDIPTYLGDDIRNNDVQSEQERIYRKADSEDITKGFESISD